MEWPHFDSVEQPVAMMKHEHTTEGERFEEIAALTNNYTPPADACSTYRVTFAMLEEFEQDLHTHIHLENNILFPRAIALEKEMNSDNMGFIVLKRQIHGKFCCLFFSGPRTHRTLQPGYPRRKYVVYQWPDSDSEIIGQPHYGKHR